MPYSRHRISCHCSIPLMVRRMKTLPFLSFVYVLGSFLHIKYDKVPKKRQKKRELTHSHIQRSNLYFVSPSLCACMCAWCVFEHKWRLQ